MLSRSCARLVPALSRGRARALLRPHPLSAAADHQQQPSPSRRHPNNIDRRTWSDAPKAKKKGLSEGASSGRVAWYEENAWRKRKASKLPKLCSGCGVEMVSQRPSWGPTEERRMAAGRDAVEEDRSKKAQKKARYADVLENPNENTLCGRCKALQGGNVWKAYDALKDVDAKVFSSQLAHIVKRRRFGLCVVVVDATDPEFSAVRKLRDSIGSTPCILAINKADLLPRPMNRYDLNFLKARVENNRMRTTVGAYGVSALNGDGMVELAEGILEELGGRDVFVVGSANVGKSTLVKSLSSLLARTMRMRGRSKKADDKRRNVLRNLNITQSHLPGTTLQAVRIPCFPSARHALWDTPGIINRAALAYSLFPSHLMEELAKPERIEVPTEGNRKKIRVEGGYSILIEAGWVEDALKDAKEKEGEMSGMVLKSEDEEDEHDAEGKREEKGDEKLEMVSKDEEGEDDVGSDEISHNKEEQNDDDDDNDTSSVKPSNDEDDQQQNNDNWYVDDDRFTLARLDIVEDNGMSIEALAFVPPCLTVRIVPTERAPTVSSVPKAYIDKVQKLVGAAGNFTDSDVSRPLGIYKGDGHGVNRDGSVDCTLEKHGKESGWIRQDVVFASLGWINLNHKRDFTVKPWCVKDSLWSKRRALYPSNLENLEDTEDTLSDDTAGFDRVRDDDPLLSRIGSRLADAAERGRHQGDMRGRRLRMEKERYSRDAREAGYAEHVLEGLGVEEEDEWY